MSQGNGSTVAALPLSLDQSIEILVVNPCQAIVHAMCPGMWVVPLLGHAHSCSIISVVAEDIVPVAEAAN